MIYSIYGTQPDIDFPLETESPREALAMLAHLRTQNPHESFKVERDGRSVLEIELIDDQEAFDIRQVREEAANLPDGHRPGRNGNADLTAGANGNRISVWKASNPDNRFDE